jgi:hypothetical protein
VGQAVGLVVYVRNLMFAEKARRRAVRRHLRAERRAETTTPASSPKLSRIDQKKRRTRRPKPNSLSGSLRTEPTGYPQPGPS